VFLPGCGPPFGRRVHEIGGKALAIKNYEKRWNLDTKEKLRARKDVQGRTSMREALRERKEVQTAESWLFFGSYWIACLPTTQKLPDHRYKRISRY
jgi:hypothetical protein